MIRNELDDLATFAVVAEERSFTRAAARLGVSQSALSQTIRALERRLGLQLLARTTRSVSPTAAGRALLEDLSPALERIHASLAKVRQLRDRPAGRIRLAMARTAATMVLMPKLAHFTRTYSDIVLEVTIVNDAIDLIAGEFDAGIEIGEFIERDMIAVPVTQDFRLAVVGSPEYFRHHSLPHSPLDLKEHACVAYRFDSGVYRWEFEKSRRQITLSPQGPVSFNDSELVLEAIQRGVGVGMVIEEVVSDLVARRRLIQVLRDWCPVFPGFFLYYPSRRNQPAALSALIQTLRLSA